MNARHDPELDDILQDEELKRIGLLLGSAQRPDPPLDDAFRSGLRRQLMQRAWEMGEGRPNLWKRIFAPPGLAWVGATAGLVLIAVVVVIMATQPTGGFNQIVINSPLDGSKAVALRDPILVNFNQPMDHPSTEAAVQITPATTVTFSWSSNTLAVQPASGNLAPNTQYQVTIGPGALTAAKQPLTTAQTITFVTQPPAPPPPSPSPTPRAPATPTSMLTGEHQLAPLGGTLASSATQWSADSSTVYFVGSNGALDAVPAKGGDVSIVAPDGASSPAIAPAGDRLAYIRGGKIEVLTFAAGTTADVAVSSAPTLVGWANDQLVWASSDGFWKQGANGPNGIAPLPSDGVVLSIAPDGTHAVYRRGQLLYVIDLADAHSGALGQAGTQFFGWSPDGSQVMYSNPDNSIAVSDLQGNGVGTLPSSDPSWSTQDAVLLGSATDLYEARPDGTALTKLANGTYRQPQWAPNGTAFVFFRGGALWTASAPGLPPLPSVLDQASAVVSSFMQARQKGQSDAALALLDGNGKQAYASGGLNLVITGDPYFSRFYVLTQTVTGTKPDTATFVVRIVLTHGKLDVADFDETLTLVRDAATRQLLVDQAVAGEHRDLGKGAEVVGVVVAADSIQVTFDSDLDPATVADGVRLLDSKGRQVDVATTYANRTVTIGGVDLKPGAQYKLVVLTTVRDVAGHNVAAEYDLQLVGPLRNGGTDHKSGGVVTASPSPTPPSPASPTPGPTPAPT